MGRIPARLRRLVLRRAGGRCEYCGLAQIGQEATFHIDHIVPLDAGGPTAADNLALACVSCSLRKEARRSAADPRTGRGVPLFHPRRQHWHRHFRWEGPVLVGRTRVGRVTVAVLDINHPQRIELRRRLIAAGEFPA